MTSLKGKPSFDTFCDQWEELWSSWQRYSTACLPSECLGCRRVNKLTLNVLEPEVIHAGASIPQDADGTPVFPELDTNTTPAAAAAEVLRDFIAQLWGMWIVLSLLRQH